jgi:cytochrome c5
MACHGTGVMGAPKVGDAAAWKPRVAQGMNTLYGHATKGFKMMPPRGGNPGLKDDEVKAAIDFMVGKSKSAASGHPWWRPQVSGECRWTG